jgi:hypothetical protein
VCSGAHSHRRGGGHALTWTVVWSSASWSVAVCSAVCSVAIVAVVSATGLAVSRLRSYCAADLSLAACEQCENVGPKGTLANRRNSVQ